MESLSLNIHPFNEDEIKARSSSISSSTIDINLSSNSQPEEEGALKLTKKKYNVINEEVRKQIIKKLTKEKANIKEVAAEFGLKLSTCKAILQVYLREGRIGKKATRDRKTKIVNTIIIATMNPLNPLQQLTMSVPYVQVSEIKGSSKIHEETNNSSLIEEALKKAQEHLKTLFAQNEIISHTTFQKELVQKELLASAVVARTIASPAAANSFQSNNIMKQSSVGTPKNLKRTSQTLENIPSSFKLTKASSRSSPKIGACYSPISPNFVVNSQNSGVETIQKKVFLLSGNNDQVVANNVNHMKV